MQIFSSHQSKDGKLRDLCDGHMFLTNPLFGADAKGLQIHLYYDDVEICNPLDSKAKIHKLGIILLHGTCSFNMR